MGKRPTTGLEFMNAVADIIGLPLHSSKIVIVAEVSEVVQVYIRQELPRDDLPAFMQVVKELSVADDGAVSVTPHETDLLRQIGDGVAALGVTPHVVTGGRP